VSVRDSLRKGFQVFLMSMGVSAPATGPAKKPPPVKGSGAKPGPGK
jgi:hypothetical protein